MKCKFLHPGKILKDLFIIPMNLSQFDVAIAAGIAPSRITDLVKGRRGITTDSAIRLGLAFGVGPEFWFTAQWNHDRERAFRKNGNVYKTIKRLK